MDPVTTSTPAGSSETDRIELVVPMRAEFATTLRTLAASVGADIGFSIDEIDDVRLAISEVLSGLVDASEDRHERARIELSAQPGSITATLGREGSQPDISLDDLAEHILRSVTDHYEVGPDGITFVKHGIERSDDAPTP
jgi:serine/threonine-protein kinase RsbW